MNKKLDFLSNIRHVIQMNGSQFDFNQSESFHMCPSEDSFGRARGNWTPRKNISTIMVEKTSLQTQIVNETSALPEEPPRKLFYFLKETGALKERAEYSLWIFPLENS